MSDESIREAEPHAPAFDDGGDGGGEVLKTRVNPRWSIKLGVIAIACLVFVLWGLYDGLVAYPKRGETVSVFLLRDYLKAAEDANRLRDARVEDPAARLAELEATDDAALTNVQRVELAWLTSLSRIEDLNELTAANRAMLDRPIPEREDTRTWFVNPQRTLDAIEAQVQGQTPPKPLSGYDIASQFVIAGVAFIGLAYLVQRIGRTYMVAYRYRPASKTLILPGGREIAPADVELVDKRKWDKFYVYLKLQGSSEEIELDLMRFVPLEEWVLEMEPETAGYEPEEDVEPAFPAGGEADEPAGPSDVDEPADAQHG